MPEGGVGIPIRLFTRFLRELMQGLEDECIIVLKISMLTRLLWRTKDHSFCFLVFPAREITSEIHIEYPVSWLENVYR